MIDLKHLQSKIKKYEPKNYKLIQKCRCQQLGTWCMIVRLPVSILNIEINDTSLSTITTGFIIMEYLITYRVVNWFGIVVWRDSKSLVTAANKAMKPPVSCKNKKIPHTRHGWLTKRTKKRIFCILNISVMSDKNVCMIMCCIYSKFVP